MVENNRKLHNQFDTKASASSHIGSNTGKDTFRGVSVFVDGYTVPSNQELQGYMLNCGGKYENYFSRHHVTHIICSNLPNSKTKNLRNTEKQSNLHSIARENVTRIILQIVRIGGVVELQVRWTMIHLVLKLQCAIVCPAQNLLWIWLLNHHLYVILIWELMNLPPELFTELNGIYGGKLVDYVSKNKQENTSATVPHEQTHGNVQLVSCSYASCFDAYHAVVEKEEIPSSAGGYHVEVSTSGPGNTDIMPYSSSQVDTSVLQQLPQELRIDMLGQLPAHRTNDISSSASVGPPAEKPPELLGLSDKSSWGGLMSSNPAHGSKFITILRNTILESQHPLDSSSDSWIEAVYSFSELLRGYIRLKIDSDIEEIYIAVMKHYEGPLSRDFGKRGEGRTLTKESISSGLPSLHNDGLRFPPRAIEFVKDLQRQSKGTPR
ncbi:unnamed protein product [Malus baccata var. baccata]